MIPKGQRRWVEERRETLGITTYGAATVYTAGQT